jgi:hypothetical protein
MTDAAEEKADVGTVTVKKQPSERVPRVSCLVCGAPFATEKQVRRVHEKLHFSEQLAATCPGCRGATFRGAMEKVLSSQK